MDEDDSVKLILDTLERGVRQRAALRASPEESVYELGAGTWQISVDRYQATLLVADGCCVLIDALDESRAERVWALVRSVTDLPLRALIHSHHHLDHIGGTERFLGVAECTADFEIIGTRECARTLERHRSPIPAPTRLLPDEDGELTIGGRAILHGAAPGHCSDNTWFIVPDAQVLHCVDILHPGELEFEGFGIAADMVDYEATLHRLLELDWSVIVAGHGKLGTPDDVRSAIRYLVDIRAALDATKADLAGTGLLDKPATASRDVVVAAAVARLEPAWGDRSNFATDAWSHVNAVFWSYYYLGG